MQVFEQQSSSTWLPSSQSSFSWLTVPSPQRAGGTDVLVVELVLVEVELLVLLDVLLLELVLVEVELLVLLDVLVLELVLELVVVLELVLLDVLELVLVDVLEDVLELVDVVVLVLVELVDGGVVGVVVASVASRPAATIFCATRRPTSVTPRLMRSVEKGAHRLRTAFE